MNERELELHKQQMAAYHNRLRVAEAPLIAALTDAGFPVRSVWDFVNGPTPVDAIPLLLKHLARDYPFRIKEGIARSLALRQSDPAVLEALIREFVKTDPGTVPESFERYPFDRNVAVRVGYKDALGFAIEAGATKADFDRLVELVLDERHGGARYGLIMALAHKNRDRAGDVLLPLLEQRDVRYPVIDALAYLRDVRARAVIEPLANAPKSKDSREQNIRLVARKYIKRIGVELVDHAVTPGRKKRSA